MIRDRKEYKILIIEDNIGDFTLVEDFLYEHIQSPDIKHIESYRAAKTILEKQRFDVILLDLSLPDKTDEALIRELLPVCFGTPVIVLTGYVDYTFGIKSLSMGISDYILKDEITALSLYKSIIYSLERKKATLELEESEKKYSDLFQLSPIPMWVFDLESLQFMDVNLAAIHHYGYTKEEFLSMTIKEIRPQSELPKLEKALGSPKKSGKMDFRGIFIHRKKNGQLIQVDIQSNTIRYKDRAAKVILANDVTERLDYIDAIEKQNESLLEISWLQSHVIRAPLARIMGLVPLLKKSSVTDDENQEILDYIMISSNELDHVIRNITDKTVNAAYRLEKRAVR